MEDLFLHATSNLDKILDEFEEKEVSAPKPVKTKSTEATKRKPSQATPSTKLISQQSITSFNKKTTSVNSSSINKSNVFSHSNDSFQEKYFDKQKDEILSDNAPSAVIQDVPNENDSDNAVGMLIDLFGPNINTANSVIEPVAQNNTLQELDFLLSVLPQHGSVDDSEKLATATESQSGFYNNSFSLTSANGTDIESNETVSQPEENLNTDLSNSVVNHLHANPNTNNKELVIGFTDDVEINDSEFNSFMEDQSLSNVNLENLSKENVSFDNNSKGSIILQNVNNSDLQTSPSDSYISEIPESTKELANIQLQKEPFTSLTPLPSSSAKSSANKIQTFEKSKKNEVQNLQKTIGQTIEQNNRNPFSSTTSNIMHNDAFSSHSNTSLSLAQHLHTQLTSEHPRHLNHTTTMNDESVPQTSSTVRSFVAHDAPAIPPPSYSSVIAGDYTAGTVIEAARSNGGSSQTVDESVEQALEATEDTTQAMTNPGSNVINPITNTSHVQRPGYVKPHWIPDKESSACTKCQSKFTLTRRRHHCRACGKIFCSNCCNNKSKLPYLNFDEARVCVTCYMLLTQAEVNASTANPSVPIPSSALRTDNTSTMQIPKSVRFSDGTKPYHPESTPSTPPPPSVRMRHARSLYKMENVSNILPPLIVEFNGSETLNVEDDPDPTFVLTLLRTNGNDIVTFALSANLFVMVKLVQYCSTLCYYFISSGLDTVGQSEVALLLEIKPDDDSFPIQAFRLYAHLFNIARKGKTVQANDFIPVEELTNQNEYVFGSTNYAGFLFVRRTVQNADDLLIEHTEQRSILFSPTVDFSSTLFVILVQVSEVPWAKLFYSRLLLGLGAKYQRYPYPLINFQDRSPVYFEVANTILGILCDFRNYKYKVVTVAGLSVLISQTGITVNIPCNRFTDVIKIMNSSNEHVLALGSDTFLTNDDTGSHLVSVQNPTSRAYASQVLTNMTGQNEDRGLVGAAFIVFNGSLKSGSTQQARCTVVEDGVMIQMLPDKMAALKESLKAMEDFRISGTNSSIANGTNEPDIDLSSSETSMTNHSMEVRWVEDDTKFNIGIMSPIDFRSFEGVLGYNVQGKSEKREKNQILRWNQVFFFKTTSDIIDMSRLAERVANGCFESLLPHLKLLRSSSQRKIGVRINIHPDDVGYSVGSRGLPLPDQCLNALDNGLIPLTIEASSNLQAEDDPVVFELIFSVLDIRSSWRAASSREL